MKPTFITLIFIFVCCLSASGQDCPPNMICLNQQQANIAAENARLRPELENKIKVLEEALTAEKQNTADVRATAAKNEADLKERLKITEIELSFEKGKNVGLASENVSQRAIITAFLPMIRKKCNAAIVLFC